MNCFIKLIFYGTPAACEMARNALENQPQVRRVDALESGAVRAFLSAGVTEGEWIALFQKSGISGFQICR